VTVGSLAGVAVRQPSGTGSLICGQRFVRGWLICHKSDIVFEPNDVAAHKASQAISRRAEAQLHDRHASLFSRARRGACPWWGGGWHFSRAGETVARSTDARRTRCSGDPGFTVRPSARRFLFVIKGFSNIGSRRMIRSNHNCTSEIVSSSLSPLGGHQEAAHLAECIPEGEINRGVFVDILLRCRAEFLKIIGEAEAVQDPREAEAMCKFACRCARFSAPWFHRVYSVIGLAGPYVAPRPSQTAPDRSDTSFAGRAGLRCGHTRTGSDQRRLSVQREVGHSPGRGTIGGRPGPRFRTFSDSLYARARLNGNLELSPTDNIVRHSRRAEITTLHEVLWMRPRQYLRAREAEAMCDSIPRNASKKRLQNAEMWFSPLFGVYNDSSQFKPIKMGTFFSPSLHGEPRKA
jgi:hypothetical protein